MRLDPVEGSEQAGFRPALILSPDVINVHCPVVLIAPFTSRRTDRIFPLEVVVQPPEGGLQRRSKVLLMHTRSVDKRRIKGRRGVVAAETMRRVEFALKVAAGLIPM